MRTSARSLLLLSCGLCVAGAACAQNFAWEVRPVAGLGGYETYVVDLDNLGRVYLNSQLPGGYETRGYIEDHGQIQFIGGLGDPLVASRMNARGEIRGIGRDDLQRTYVYRNGTPIPLVAPGEVSMAGGQAFGPNDRGQMVTTYMTQGESYRTSLIQPDGSFVDIGTLGGHNTWAVGLNQSGQVAGTSMLPGVLGAQPSRAFLYSNGTMTNLGTLGGDQSNARDLNERGQVLGEASTTNNAGRHAFLYGDGTMTDLGTLGGNISISADLNDLGQAVGHSGLDPAQSSDEFHAFLYRDGRMLDLDPLFGDSTSSRATRINNTGQVLASAMVTDRRFGRAAHLFFYDNGQAIDLTEYMQASFNDLLTIEGAWLNDVGQIALRTSIAGETHIFLMSPVPEPAVWALLLVGAVALGAKRVRQRGFALGSTAASA
jgi:probable HAF family extracellular repeat protein